MNDLIIGGIIMLFVCVVVSRIISEKALKHLSSEQKVNLLDNFSSHRKYYFIPLVLIFLIYVAVGRSFPYVGKIIYLLFVIFIIVYLIVMHIRTSKKLSQLKLPKQYLKLYAISRVVYYIGFVCLLGPIVVEVIPNI